MRKFLLIRCILFLSYVHIDGLLFGSSSWSNSSCISFINFILSIKSLWNSISVNNFLFLSSFSSGLYPFCFSFYFSFLFITFRVFGISPSSGPGFSSIPLSPTVRIGSYDALAANFACNYATWFAYSGSSSSTSVLQVLYFLLSNALFRLCFMFDAKP